MIVHEALYFGDGVSAFVAGNLSVCAPGDGILCAIGAPEQPKQGCEPCVRFVQAGNDAVFSLSHFQQNRDFIHHVNHAGSAREFVGFRPTGDLVLRVFAYVLKFLLDGGSLGDFIAHQFSPFK
ncbi:MAG: hypothetical protein RR893_13610 [Clostridia bacterium]